MKAMFHCDEIEKDAVSHNSYNIDHTEGNPNPHVELLQAWDSHQNESPWIVTGQVEGDHSTASGPEDRG
jgi:hypothetical protein